MLRWPVVGTALAWCGIGLVAGALVHPAIAVLAGAVLVALGYFVGPLSRSMSRRCVKARRTGHEPNI